MSFDDFRERAARVREIALPSVLLCRGTGAIRVIAANGTPNRARSPSPVPSSRVGDAAPEAAERSTW